MLRRPNGEKGFTLVTLVVLIAVMNILLAVLIPIWSQRMQREKEHELIFRGLQYAEAIRVFHERFGRYPVRLQELLDVKPRSIRRLWKDPMSKDGQWALIYAGAAMPGSNGRPGDQGGQPPPQTGNTGGQIYPQSGQNGQAGTGGQSQGNGEGAAPQPILGVHSKSTGHSLVSFFGKREYDQWLFTVRLVQAGIGMGGKRGPMPRLSSGAIGRPFRGQVIPGTTPAPHGVGGPSQP